jgi:DNA-binding transcriptional ArsR family regulator
MEKDYLVKLTTALYKVTELLPKEEPLKFLLRYKAGEVLADSILIFLKNPVKLSKEQTSKLLDNCLANLEVLQSYFDLAEGQEWVKKENFFVLKREYLKLKEEIKKAAPKKTLAQASEQKKERSLGTKREDVGGSVDYFGIRNRRIGRIIEFLKEKGAAQVKDLKEIFPEVSKRTLRRDFDYLLKRGLVEREGDSSRTVYKLRLGQ